MERNLPNSIYTKGQLLSVLHEIEKYIDALVQVDVVHKTTQKMGHLPSMSVHLQGLLAENSLEATTHNMESLRDFLVELQDSSPIVRFSFASEPPTDILHKIVSWLRKETGLFVLIKIGIQPTVAAGCVMYTPNHRYDFSLRAHLLGSTKAFKKVLHQSVPSN